MSTPCPSTRPDPGSLAASTSAPGLSSTGSSPSMLSYMGTKQRMAGAVAQAVAQLRRGPVLDAFAGMCAACCELSTSRNVWTNDAQQFASSVGKSLFCAATGPPTLSRTRSLLRESYHCNQERLETRFAAELDLERACLDSERLDDVISSTADLPHVGNSPELAAERASLASTPSAFPYRLMTITYAGSYFGLKQSMAIDSIRYAIDQAASLGLVDDDERRWLTLALGAVLLRVSNSTGHFAQFLQPNVNNLQRFIVKRRREVWPEFLGQVEQHSPIGDRAWRSGNRSYREDALELLEQLKGDRRKPAVVYADPPYSKAQYSRYYHLLDTLVSYDYPEINGKGRYRPGRFQTPFSHKSGVVAAFDSLVVGASELGAALVVSYPQNGLLEQVGYRVLPMLRRHYRQVRLVATHQLGHSSFGAPKAPPTLPVMERIYVADR